MGKKFPNGPLFVLKIADKISDSTLYHYKVEMGPVNFQNLNHSQISEELSKIKDVESIGKLHKFLIFIKIQGAHISPCPYKHHLDKIGDFDGGPYKHHFQNWQKLRS